MSNKVILILILDILIFILLLKLVFRSWKEFKRCLYYLIKPDFISMIEKDWHKDFRYTLKFTFVIIIMVIIVFLELRFLR